MFADVKPQNGRSGGPSERLPMTELVSRHSYLRDLSDKMIAEQEALSLDLQRDIVAIGEDASLGEGGAARTADIKLAEIDELEQEIRIIGYQMALIEDVIFETPPRDSAEALSKLRFLSGQMQDGYEFSPDYFANVMEECSDLLSETGFSGVDSVSALPH